MLGRKTKQLQKRIKELEEENRILKKRLCKCKEPEAEKNVVSSIKTNDRVMSPNDFLNL